MANFNHNIPFSVIIPTYNREDDLRKCLASILGQTFLPQAVVIVDDGALKQEFLAEQRKSFSEKRIALLYHKKNHSTEPKGTSCSRNIGLRMAESKVLFILDDDLILDKDFFEKIIGAWEEEADPWLLGVGGVIRNNRGKGKLEKTYNRLFGLSSKQMWDVNNVGFQVWDDGLKKRTKGYYVHGGASSYDKHLVQKLGGFSVLCDGRTALEDVEFCLKAKRAGLHFVIEPNAKVFHNQSPTSREGDFLAGVKEGYNRKTIFRAHTKIGLRTSVLFFWANLGWILRQVLILRWRKACGMTVGSLKK